VAAEGEGKGAGGAGKILDRTEGVAESGGEAREGTGRRSDGMVKGERGSEGAAGEGKVLVLAVEQVIGVAGGRFYKRWG
jgi:hypothetical protein